MGYQTRAWHVNVVLLEISLTVLVCTSLTCWKCIGKSCTRDPANDYRASRITCRDGEQCMKVYYKMEDVNASTTYESVTRSCSLGHCQQLTTAAFDTCIRSKHYNISGCALRMCCNHDFCNTGSSMRDVSNLLSALSFILFVHVVK
ncbi:uncharacterized protein LOC121382064 [Gigantopelta aegis]|uniref:uncharacterized protein LOC121382064 n=1 Tax=Gigantopelta aegis TaxID=1735272 RepID=UPI001B88CA65|nr:uncharacterized protein LOC121382064 [Gigantopelta aegis]